MARKRLVALCTAFITVVLVIACFPAATTASSDLPCHDKPLPLSLAAPPGGRMYFLPAYDEVTSFSPAKKLYNLPVIYEADEVPEELNAYADYEVSGQATDLYCIESITPRAP